MSATAKRNGMQLIAVIMGAKTRDERNAAARALLDFGFSNYALYTAEERALENVPVYNGVKSSTVVYTEKFSCIIPKSYIKKVDMVFDIPTTLTAPISELEKVGSIKYKIGDEVIGESKVYVMEKIEKISVSDVFERIIKKIFMG